MVRFRVVQALTFGACLTTTIAAQAGDAAKADALFKQGRAALEAGDYPRACDLLERSLAEEPASGALLNLAFCHQMVGKAWLAYREYSRALEQPLPAERRSFAERGRSQAARKLPHVQLELGDGPTPRVEYEDGTPVETPRAPFPVEPGRRTIVLHAPGVAPRAITFEAPARAVLIAVIVTAAEATTVEEERSPVGAPLPAPSAAFAPPPPATAEREGRPLSTAGLAVTGVGVIGVGLGAFFGLRSFAIRDSACPNEACDAAGLERIRGGATTTATISTVSFVAGAVALAGGAVMLLTSASRSR